MTDAYFLLAKADGFAAYGGKPDRAPIVAEFGSEIALEVIEQALVQKLGLVGAVTGFYRHGCIVSCVVPTDWLDDLQSVPGLLRFELALPFAGRRMRPRFPGRAACAGQDNNEATAPIDCDQSVAAVQSKTSSTTLRAAIDTGCPFAHIAFRRATAATAVRAIWDQDPQPDFEQAGESSSVAYGRVLHRSAMNAAIAAHPTHVQNDERDCYQYVGYGELSRSSGHGAATLGLLSHGIATRVNGAPNDDLAFVQLPRQLLSIPSRAALARSILDGVAWIMQQRLPQENKVVICVAYASSLTAHDDSSLLARGLKAHIDAASKINVSLEIVFAAGNDYEESLHAELPDGRFQSVRWRQSPGNDVPSYAEVWITPTNAQGFKDTSLAVVTPSGEFVAAPLNASSSVNFSADGNLAVVKSSWTACDKAQLVLLRLSPTAATGDYIIASPSGSKASIYVSHRSGTTGYAFRPSRSKLVDMKIAGGVVKGEGTLNGFACFKEAVVVGAYEMVRDLCLNPSHWKPTPTSYSASGPARITLIKDCVDFSAMANQSSGSKGVPVFGNFTSTVTRAGGTSVAAPQAARDIALSAARKIAACDKRLGVIVQP